VLRAAALIAAGQSVAIGGWTGHGTGTSGRDLTSAPAVASGLARDIFSIVHEPIDMIGLQTQVMEEKLLGIIIGGT
jgi:hypothetical protein